MSEVTVPENPEPVDAEETQDSAGEQDSEAEEDAGAGGGDAEEQAGDGDAGEDAPA